jgi:hypothetical protein
LEPRHYLRRRDWATALSSDQKSQNPQNALLSASSACSALNVVCQIGGDADLAKGVRGGLMRFVSVHGEQGIKEMVTAKKQSDRDDRKHGERDNPPSTHS